MSLRWDIKAPLISLMARGSTTKVLGEIFLKNQGLALIYKARRTSDKGRNSLSAMADGCLKK